MTDIQIFKNSDFGEVRTFQQGDTILFCGSDIAKALGYAKPNNAINQHCKGDTLKQGITDSLGREQQATFITEGDVYRLIISSKLPTAEKFEKWVFDEILPTIRKIMGSLENIEYQGDINGLVYSKDNTAMTTSRNIAQVFQKNHREILRLIDTKFHSNNKSVQFCTNHIKEVIYYDSQNKVQREYELDEEGFSFIALGLTGAKADEFKIKYIEAFSKMKEAIQNMFKARIIENVLPQDNRLRQYLYIIKNPLNETIKIGVAQDVEKRIKQLQTGAGVELELIYQSMICSNAFNIEKDVHNHFQKYRTFGEWFNVNPEIVISFLEKQTFVLKSEFNKYFNNFNHKNNKTI